MFVKTTRRRRGDKTYEYLSLAESVRDGAKTRHRTLLRLGEVTALRRSGRLDRIVATLEKHLETERVDVGSLEADAAPAVGAVGAVACAAALWGRLGLDGWFAAAGAERDAGRLADAVFAMAANRLVAPCSKRRLGEWAQADVVMPESWQAPSPWQYYRALDHVADLKEGTEEFLFARLCDLTSIDLKFVCCDLTSTYLEGATSPSDRFESKAFGYSRDRRPDRPQIVIGLLCTGDGIPIAHHMFAGNTADASTLPDVLADLTARFAVGRICVVADRGLISADNVAAVAAAGCDHVLATRLHRDKACQEALETIDEGTQWADVPNLRCRAAEAALADGTRAVIVESDARMRRDTNRTAELVARTETALLALEERVRCGRLVDAAKIGRAAQRIIGQSGVGRLFDLDTGEGRFVYHYDQDAHAYEKLLAGRYVLTTSLTSQQASAERVVAAYRQLADAQARFRTLTDFGRLRPIRHWTEQRVRGHIAVCVYAAVAETLITRDLQTADIADPDLPDQHLTAARALRELDRIREVRLRADAKPVTVTTRRSPLQTQILAATATPTRHWDKARIG
ncbi:IS1634 family transposase [Candidatus Poriferisodalis sp.]|uniref:IS1634 family transposase n=1 Tax=Candidatus Poriferisodalis sp. TaxID=3101277 RepID=UPI003B01A6EC